MRASERSNRPGPHSVAMPNHPPLLLRQVRLVRDGSPGADTPVDVLVADGRIARVSPTGGRVDPSVEVVDLEGGAI